MTNNHFIVPILAAAIFCIAKYVEDVYIEKNEVVALKVIVRDGILVFLCAFAASLGMYGLEGHVHQLLNMITETKMTKPDGETQIFTDAPGF